MPHSNNDNWHVIYTYPNFEKKIYSELAKRNVEVYLPLYHVKRKWSDRIKLLEKPFFPNYLFVRPVQERKYEILHIGGIVKYIAFDGRKVTVSDKEIGFIRSLMDLQHSLLASGKQVEEGETIMVLNGIMKGLNGSVIRRLHTSNMVILFESMNHTIAIDLNNNVIINLPAQNAGSF
ncbi:MAG TPA: UpxY family transcription antiterminator [Chitinophaga sp.]|uniref:transcription termination/antitermination protein NusG n=1 Tax=Chitinophaga sp. TaxID=1869181 RepID=UPI002C05F117|nr:UpxY family transcription antiterminator [Chitinophaga sp.]HVI46502.1 UpxY family transcription antiterminator [Chitinophaga sp.]